MDGTTSIDLDKLPIRRLESIDESGTEHFAPEVGTDENRLNLIRRIDFSTVIERDKKKAKKSEEEKEEVGSWPWQSLVENLQQAQQELSVILDLINTVEANDAVTVAGMTRPKPLPNEVLLDLSVSAATKLQKFRHLGKYFKQSSKALEKQVAKETRFYGALIRLQQNWKVKRQRLGASGPGSEGFTFDLLDNMSSDAFPFSFSHSMPMVRFDRDSAGMLALQSPPKSCCFLHFGFLQNGPGVMPVCSTKKKICNSSKHFSQEDNKADVSEEDVNDCVKASHSVLREIHQAIFDEQAFDLVTHETFNPASGVNIIGMREDFLQLGIGQGSSVFLRLMPAQQDDIQQTIESELLSNDSENGIQHSNVVMEEKHNISRKTISRFPNPECFQIYLSHMVHENVLSKVKERCIGTKFQVSGQPRGDGSGIISHFCMSIAHRIFSNKVLSALENLASGVPYLLLLTHPTWHSRISSWSLSMKVSQSTIHADRCCKHFDSRETKDGIKMQFHTTIVVTDEYISVSGESASSVIGSFGSNSMDSRPLNSYGCDLMDLPVILSLQVASQIISWLHEEALVVGMKANRDFLSLYFDLEEGNKIGLTAHVDPDDIHGCISWWLIMDDGSMVEGKPHTKITTEHENRRFLGHLSLEALHSILMDLVCLCNSVGNH